ncbi:MAG: tRNA (adenosine(37)-N6)-threonylcarbamoyltransferase complex dimerization subunit type 1 TsaB [Chitinophagaceae bacterium]|nr:tRNA (adenosine(37)-N6)-threonylcarbamoyltransferase complex dimerization subunit type 1 TsaB [Chitinophagaceae bacterium]
MLHIETSGDTASICLSDETTVLRTASNPNQKEHSTWLHPSIKQLMADEKLEMKDIMAVAVSIGPGSYTGLRIGLSAAKGLCYALRIPLITIGTLEIMALSALDENTDLVSPVIDARRMEVFNGVYDRKGIEVIPPRALILDEHVFDDILAKGTVCFCGNGKKKLQNIITHTNAKFSDNEITAADMAVSTYHRFLHGKFANLAYTQPLYIKEFYTPLR